MAKKRTATKREIEAAIDPRKTIPKNMTEYEREQFASTLLMMFKRWELSFSEAAAVAGGYVKFNRLPWKEQEKRRLAAWKRQGWTA